LFKRKIFDEVSVSTARRAGDTDTVYKLLFATKKIIFFDKSFCYYRQRGNSLWTGSASVEKSLELLEISEKMKYFFEKKHPKLVPYCNQKKFTKCVSVFYYLDRGESGNAELLNKLSKEISILYKKIKHDLTLKKRIFYFLLMFSSKQNIFTKLPCFVIMQIYKKYKCKYDTMHLPWKVMYES